MASRGSWQKVFWMASAYFALTIGMIGVILPLLPTTPFLLLAIWAGSHASDKFKWWLLRHSRFGVPLRNWYREKALSRRTKLTAVAVLSASWLFIILRGSPSGAIALTGIILASCAGFLLTRPEPGNRAD